MQLVSWELIPFKENQLNFSEANQPPQDNEISYPKDVAPGIWSFILNKSDK